jgi:hypothetical protein
MLAGRLSLVSDFQLHDLHIELHILIMRLTREKTHERLSTSEKPKLNALPKLAEPKIPPALVP